MTLWGIYHGYTNKSGFMNLGLTSHIIKTFVWLQRCTVHCTCLDSKRYVIAFSLEHQQSPVQTRNPHQEHQHSKHAGTEASQCLSLGVLMLQCFLSHDAPGRCWIFAKQWLWSANEPWFLLMWMVSEGFNTLMLGHWQSGAALLCIISNLDEFFIARLPEIHTLSAPELRAKVYLQHEMIYILLFTRWIYKLVKITDF